MVQKFNVIVISIQLVTDAFRFLLFLNSTLKNVKAADKLCVQEKKKLSYYDQT